MTTEVVRHLKPLWFGDDASLLGHLHVPRGQAIDIAVVICATPFGYENIAGHRGLRILADRLAADGVASLCFDFPGTGDSDGSQTVTAWRSAVASAVLAIRSETGCTRVGVIGVGLGATLTLASLDVGVNVDKIVLWEPHFSGREWLRKQRAHHRIATFDADQTTPPPPPPDGIEEINGFPMTEALSEGLATLDLSSAQPDCWPPGRRRPDVLVIARKVKGMSPRQTAPFAERGITVQLESWDGLDQMYVEPHLSIAPVELFDRMRDWLAEGVPARDEYTIGALPETSARTKIGADGAVEEVARYSVGDEGLLFSIETRPVGRMPRPIWLVLLTGRAVRHIGPNRIWVRIARELAREGFASVRLDGRSVGDSDGAGNGLMPNEEYYQEHIYDDIERIMELAKSNGANEFLMTGICSGATASYQVAWRRSDVRAIVMLSPLQLRHDPEDDERAKVQLAKAVRFRWHRLIDPQLYFDLIKGTYPVRKVLGLMYTRVSDTVFHRRKLLLDERSYVYNGFHALAAKPVEIDVFISSQDHIANAFLERHFGSGFKGFRGERLRVQVCPNADHTIRPFHAQEMFFGVLRMAVKRISGSEIQTPVS